MKIIITGVTGLIGSRFEELMFENHEIIPVTDVDITSPDSVTDFFRDKKADFVIHFAGKTDVDGCEVDKAIDLELMETDNAKEFDINDENVTKWNSKNTAFAVNSAGTYNIYKAAKQNGIKFLYISTDFVFDGNGTYEEISEPDPINWYGMTKWFGEKIVDDENNLIVRLSFPYGYPSPVKPDFVQKIIGLLKDHDEVSLIEDSTITPTFLDDIVNGLDFLIQKQASGIFHLTGSSSDDAYHMGQKIKEVFDLQAKINPTSREIIYKDKAKRPFQSIILNDKLKNLGFEPKTFDEGLALIANIV